MLLNCSEVVVEIPQVASNPFFRAYASVVLEDAFAIRGIRVVATAGGRLLVAMPSRRKTALCRACGRSVPCGFRFCGYCGDRLGAPPDDDGERWADMAYPINAEQRRAIEGAVLRAYAAKAAEVGPAAVAPFEVQP